MFRINITDAAIAASSTLSDKEKRNMKEGLMEAYDRLEPALLSAGRECSVLRHELNAVSLAAGQIHSIGKELLSRSYGERDDRVREAMAHAGLNSLSASVWENYIDALLTGCDCRKVSKQ